MGKANFSDDFKRDAVAQGEVAVHVQSIFIDVFAGHTGAFGGRGRVESDGYATRRGAAGVKNLA